MSCLRILHNPENHLWVTQVNTLIRERKLLKHLNHVQLLLHRDMASNTVKNPFKPQFLMQQSIQFFKINTVYQSCVFVIVILILCFICIVCCFT